MDREGGLMTYKTDKEIERIKNNEPDAVQRYKGTHDDDGTEFSSDDLRWNALDCAGMANSYEHLFGIKDWDLTEEQEAENVDEWEEFITDLQAFLKGAK